MDKVKHVDRDEEQNSTSDMPIRKESVPPGTTIHCEKPFVYILNSKFQTECCDYCFKKQFPLSKCSNCKYVYYCGKTCQRQGWIVHKQECKHFKRISPKILPDAARLLFRLFIKLDNGGDMFKSYYTEKDYRMWRDLMSHYPELKKDARRMEHLSSLYCVLQDFAQGDRIPNIAELMGMYGRMCINSFSICNQELQSIGTGIYLGASIIDHSCQPNAQATFDGTTLFIRTLECLAELNWSKIRISYVDLLASNEERQKELLETYYFLCDCPKCNEPEYQLKMFAAACPNKDCDSAVEMTESPNLTCQKCNTVLSQQFINIFRSVVDLTQMHLDNMRNTTYLDVCKLCLEKQKGVLYKYHLRHIKILDLAFESSIDLGSFNDALEYGLELIQCYQKYYPKIHPLTGLLHLKLCKLLLFKENPKDAIGHLRKASDILKITHGPTSSLYKTELLPLIEQCRSLLSINGIIK